MLDADRRFESVAVRRYDWNQTYRASDYRNLMLSNSGTQMIDGSDRVGLLDDIESFIQNDFENVITEATGSRAHDRHAHSEAEPAESACHQTAGRGPIWLVDMRKLRTGFHHRRCRAAGLSHVSEFR